MATERSGCLEGTPAGVQSAEHPYPSQQIARRYGYALLQLSANPRPLGIANGRHNNNNC